MDKPVSPSRGSSHRLTSTERACAKLRRCLLSALVLLAPAVFADWSQAQGQFAPLPVPTELPSAPPASEFPQSSPALPPPPPPGFFGSNPVPAQPMVQSPTNGGPTEVTPQQPFGNVTAPSYNSFGYPAGQPVSSSSQTQNARLPSYTGMPTQSPAGVFTTTPQTESLIDDAPEPSPETFFDATRVIAVVGDEYIFEGDMIVFVEPIIQENRKRISPAQEKQLRAQLIRQVLKNYVEMKAMYIEFFRDVTGGGAPAEIREKKQQITSKVAAAFYEKQVPNYLKQYEVPDEKSLELKLRSKSISLRVLQKQFAERVLMGELERKHIPENIEIGRGELLTYYKEHQSEWVKPARARWRQLTARFNRYPTKEAAWAAIGQMFDDIFYGGKSFEATAVQKSQGPTADKGGVFDWTLNDGSLKSKPLNDFIFDPTIPVNRLSRVIEDDIGFHIVEVLEREEGYTISFEDAQPKIRKILKEKKEDDLRSAYRKSVMARTMIWTRWPEDIPGSKPLPDFLLEPTPSK